MSDKKCFFSALLEKERFHITDFFKYENALQLFSDIIRSSEENAKRFLGLLGQLDMETLQLH